MVIMKKFVILGRSLPKNRCFMEIYPRFFQPPQGSYFLFGPRGTGKSTFLNASYPEALNIDLLLPENYHRFSAHPDYLINLIQGNPQKKTIIIDEVQKVPALLDVVHNLIEKKYDRQFILSGSSARKLKRRGTDLLAGRLVYRTLHPFLFGEVQRPLILDDVLQYGLLPVVLSAREPKDTLRAYVSLYLKEEVQAEGLVRNFGNFSRFLEAISFSQGSILNISHVSRDCQVERKVVEGYLTILEDILLAYRLPAFTRRRQRKLIAHDKFYLFDCGVYRQLRPAGPLDTPAEIDGAALESLVAQNLLAWNAYLNEPYQISYWHSYEHQEVDFVLYGPAGFYAIEVKNTIRLRPEDLRGLKIFQRDYPASQALFLYRGTERVAFDRILCLPCTDFLNNLRLDSTNLPVIH